MTLIRTVAVAALGYFGYRYLATRKLLRNAAFAGEQAGGDNFSQVRDAGPRAMADDPGGWSKVDQRSDESFPASDPPATY